MNPLWSVASQHCAKPTHFPDSSSVQCITGNRNCLIYLKLKLGDSHGDSACIVSAVGAYRAQLSRVSSKPEPEISSELDVLEKHCSGLRSGLVIYNVVLNCLFIVQDPEAPKPRLYHFLL